MKTSNKILLVVLTLILALGIISSIWLRVAVFAEAIEGSGDVRQEERRLESFHKIDVAGGFKVYFTQDSAQRVIVTADSNLMDYIQTDVVNGELRVSPRSRIRSRNLQLDISALDLSQIKASGGASVWVTDILSSPELTLRGSAGSSFEVEALVERLMVHLSAGSQATLSGAAGTAEFRTSAGSQVDAYDLEAQKVRVTASSGSSLKVNAQEELNVKGSSGSNIYYMGAPYVNELNLSSGAAVHQRSR
jgi:hypothetical protein